MLWPRKGILSNPMINFFAFSETLRSLHRWNTVRVLSKKVSFDPKISMSSMYTCVWCRYVHVRPCFFGSKFPTLSRSRRWRNNQETTYTYDHLLHLRHLPFLIWYNFVEVRGIQPKTAISYSCRTRCTCDHAVARYGYMTCKSNETYIIWFNAACFSTAKCCEGSRFIGASESTLFIHKGYSPGFAFVA